LVPTDKLPRFGGFTVVVKQEFVAALAKDGITDLNSHFANQKLWIKGITAACALDLIGRETIWSLYINLNSPDQILPQSSKP
jgi:hypothetical protein